MHFAASARLALALVPALAWSDSRLTNVSVRSTAGTGADTLIVGFTVVGSGTKQLLLRGVGPALGAFGVGGAVTDPELRVFNGAGTAVDGNDNWNNVPAVTTVGDSVGAFRLPAGSRDAALLLSLPVGSYSAHLLANSGPGIALVESYDADTGTPGTQLGNISTRSTAGTGAAILTIGFSISGDTPKTVLIRAVGPTLGTFGVAGALANPQLRLFSARGVELGFNDDWLTGAGWGAVFAGAGAFSLGNTGTRDAVLVVSLPPGTYTAQAGGANSTSGVALIEVYDVPAPPSASFVFRPVQNATPANYPRSETAVAAPAPTFQARPAYPLAARIAGATGEALIQFVVRADGQVTDAFAVRANDVDFATSAVAAVSQWTFRPARNAAGQAVLAVMQIPIVYTLN